MNVTIICLGSLKEDYLKTAQEDLLGSILKKNEITACQVVELKDEPVPENASPAQMKQILELEGSKIQAKLPANSRIICLDIHGKKVDSVFFKGLIKGMKQNGENDLVFVIGGSLGISHDIKERSRQRISFASLTFPHQLFRIALLDALALYL